MRAHQACSAMAVVAALTAAPYMAHAGPTFWHGDEGFVTLNYELQIWTQWRDNYRSDEVGGDYFDTFLRRNRITLDGYYNDYVGFYAQIEAGNDDKYGDFDRSVYYRDAYVSVDYLDAMRFMLGRFKNTFSRENLEACLEPLTLDRSINSYTPFAGSRDTGFAVWGNLFNASAQYRLMIASGRKGDNVPKDPPPRVTARVHYSVFDPEWSYGYRGTYLGNRRILTFGAAYDYQEDAVYGNLPGRTDADDYQAWTVDFFYEEPTALGTFTLSAAYFDYSVNDALLVDDELQGDDQLLDPEIPPNAQMEAYYVKAGYLLPGDVGVGQLQLFARYDGSDFDRDDDYYDRDSVAVGFNYYIDGQDLKVTAEYQDVVFEEEHPDVYSLQDHSQATIGFQMRF